MPSIFSLSSLMKVSAEGKRVSFWAPFLEICFYMMHVITHHLFFFPLRVSVCVVITQSPCICQRVEKHTRVPCSCNKAVKIYASRAPPNHTHSLLVNKHQHFQDRSTFYITEFRSSRSLGSTQFFNWCGRTEAVELPYGSYFLIIRSNNGAYYKIRKFVLAWKWKCFTQNRSGFRGAGY
jgi:hypothetical protein